MEYKKNEIICHCKQVSLFDIEDALINHQRFEDVEREFEEVQRITKCSTGCGGCHDKIIGIISNLLHNGLN